MKKAITVLVFLFSMHIACAASSTWDIEHLSENSAKDSIVTSTFSITALGCGADAAAMQKSIAQTKGVKTVAVNAQKGTAVVKYDANKITKEEITKIIENCSLCHDKTAKPFKVTDVK